MFKKVKVSVTQSCLTLCDPIDCSPPGPSGGILQARILEGVAISFSRGSSRPRDWILVSCIAGRFFTIWVTGEALLIHCVQAYVGIFVKWSHISNKAAAAATAKSLQWCLTLCDPIDGSPPGSPIPGILQARTLEWVAISFSNAWKWKLKAKSLSRVWLCVTPWTAAY